MGILWRFTLRSLKANRMRTIVSIVGVMLSCALVTGIFSTVTSLDHGLLKRDIGLNGTWQAFSASETDDSLETIVKNSHTTNVVTRRVMGYASLASDDEATEVAILSVPSVEKGTGSTTVQGLEGPLTLQPEAKSGRQPQNAGELMISDNYASEWGLKVGDTIEASVAQNVVTNPQDGTRYVATPSYDYAYDRYLSYSGDYEESEEVVQIEPVNAETRTYAIVGTYENSDLWRIDNAGAFASSLIAFCGPATSADGGSVLMAYATSDLSSYGEIQSWADGFTNRSVEVPGTDGAMTVAAGSLNSELLRYQGMTDARGIWDSLWSLAAILTGVVVIASISLIYTSFAISVTERMRQFGLLRGIGASKAQLKLTVFCEALLIGVVGIPLGIAAGIAGTAVTLQLTARGFAVVLDNEAGVDLWLSAPALGICAAVSLLTLLVSAMVPALRASRVSAVEAIRQAGIGARARLGKRFRPNSGRLAQRLFGTPGLVAHRNLTRAGSRGRVVVTSLAVSCALVVTCGFLDTLLDPVSQVASSDGMPQGTDISLYMGAAYSEDGMPLSDSFSSEVEKGLDRLALVAGVDEITHSLYGHVTAIIPSDLLTSDGRTYISDYLGEDVPLPTYTPQVTTTDDYRDAYIPSFTADGDFLHNVDVRYLSDTDWTAALEKLGLNQDDFSDPQNPRAIAVNGQLTNDNVRYGSLDVFAKTGDITTMSVSYGEGTGELEGFFVYGVFVSDGKIAMRYTRSADGNGSQYEFRDVILDEASLNRTTLTIGAIAKASELGLSGLGIHEYFDGAPLLLLPASVAAANAQTGGNLTADNAYAYYRAEDSDQALAEMQGAIETDFADADWFGGYSVQNVAAILEQSVDIAGMMRMFVALFSVMTMLIALANVFNTLTNSIILRTREFATLNSVGMGRRAFVGMLAYECASYALRGLGIGFVLSAGIGLLMHKAMSVSFADTGLGIPWTYVLVATVGALAVLGLSTLYAARRTQEQNTVEALRADAL